MAKRKSKYKIVEWLIVPVILIVTAVMISPPVSSADSTDKLTKLIDNLHTMRSRLELYRVHHNGLWPGQKSAGADISGAEFVKAITGEGPGCVKQMPVNPYNSLDSVACVNDPNAVPSGTEQAGWWFNAATGKFKACDSPERIKY